VTRAFTVDATPPAPFALGAPGDGAHVGDGRPSFYWSPAFDASGLARQEPWIDGSPAGDPLGPGVSTARSPVSLADGRHTWWIVAVDPVGLRRDSVEHAFVVDTTPPVAALQAGPERTTPGVSVTVDASSSSDASGRIVRYEFDLDGDHRFESDGGGDPRIRTSYASAGTRVVGVRVTDEVGLQSVAEAHVAIVDKTGSTLPGQIPGLETVPLGLRYTNRLAIRLMLITPPFASAARLSNYGDLNDASLFKRVEVVGNARIPIDWTLLRPADPRGQDRTVTVVYEVGPDTVNWTLDIMVDLVAPSLRSAKLAGRKIRINASDPRGSGVRFARARRRGRRAPSFTRLVNGGLRRPSVRGNLEVQVRDRAGNTSKWRRVSRR
jgi:PKD domain